jgi:hypothetical protein
MEHFPVDQHAPAAAGADRIACAAVIASIAVTLACGAFAVLVQADSPARYAQAQEVEHE